MLSLLARELLFRAVCRHRQGDRPNILLYCHRRGGSTWLLNTLAAHPGMRYVGRPFLSILESRWKGRMPDLARAAGHTGTHRFRQIVRFEGEAEEQFLALARDVIEGRLHIYPALGFRSPYFHRVTDRIVFQMTSGMPMIDWFDAHLDVHSIVLFRHPIPTSLSVMREGWPDECGDFLNHRWFADEVLTAKEMDLAARVLEQGTPLARHVLDWSLKAIIPVRSLAGRDVARRIAVTYEQLVTDPDRVLAAISQTVDLPNVDAMRQQVQRPSRTVTTTTAERTDNAAYLIGRWRKRVAPAEERSLLEIPRTFGIEMYDEGRDTARQFAV